MVEKIDGFRGKYYFLDNFYPCMVELDGMLYPSVEHAFQAAKTLDMNERKHFQVMNDADVAKYYGQRVKLRPDWDDVKVDVMHNLVYDKFTRTYPFKSQSNLKAKLLSTGDAYLEEGNHHGDKFWGTVKGIGQNNLGKTLMRVRDEIKDM